jgi:hypothetical protein
VRIGKSTARRKVGPFDHLVSAPKQDLLGRSVHLMRGAIRAVKKVLPDTNPELIGGYFANLLDLWETGQELETKLREICTVRRPRDRKRLRDALLWIEAIQLDLGSYWIGEVKKDTPKLLRALDRLDRESRPRKRKTKLLGARRP